MFRLPIAGERGHALYREGTNFAGIWPTHCFHGFDELGSYGYGSRRNLPGNQEVHPLSKQWLRQPALGLAQEMHSGARNLLNRRPILQHSARLGR